MSVTSIGDLKDRVEVQLKTGLVESSGHDGGYEPVYESIGTRWARVETLSGRELLALQQLTAQPTHQVTLRYDSVIGETARLIWKYPGRDRDFNVVLVKQYERRWTVCICEEKTV